MYVAAQAVACHVSLSLAAGRRPDGMSLDIWQRDHAERDSNQRRLLTIRHRTGRHHATHTFKRLAPAVLPPRIPANIACQAGELHAACADCIMLSGTLRVLQQIRHAILHASHPR